MRRGVLGVRICRGKMFQHRASDFSPSVAAIQKHLGAVVKELEKIGRIGGRQTTEAVATASDQISDAISTAAGKSELLISYLYGPRLDQLSPVTAVDAQPC